jgi:hypothetical protein
MDADLGENFRKDIALKAPGLRPQAKGGDAAWAEPRVFENDPPNWGLGPGA